ncbi:ATP-binding protein [Saccharothrix lopnurensis]|uniref:ATP-binding protein n=1 Tax=Saccharothrix lopnurensis TaxID=1670621 RepID=A0ABW1P7V9_9PSEU
MTEQTITLTVPEVPLPETGDERERRDYLAETAKRVTDSLSRRIPPRFDHATITDPAVGRWAQGLIDAAMDPIGPRSHPLRPHISRGPSLLLLGGTGVGKTHQAWGAVRQLAATGLLRGWQFITAPDLYGELRPRAGSDSERTFREITSASLLVVDDLGAAKSSEWTEEITYRVVNSRYESERPTLWTSNLTGPELREVLGERIVSRLSTCTRITLGGLDRRRKAS